MKQSLVKLLFVASLLGVGIISSQSLYAATSKRPAITPPSSWTQVAPPPPAPDFRTQYLPPH